MGGTPAQGDPWVVHDVVVATLRGGIIVEETKGEDEIDG